MKPRLPLYTKVLALAFLNLCLLGLAIIVIVRAQFRFDPGSFLLAPAQSRIMNVAHTLALELEEVPAANWDAVLSRYSQTKRRRIGALRRIGTASGRAGPDDPPAGLRQASTTPATASSRSFQSGAEAKE
jgi:hypothetical protein